MSGVMDPLWMLSKLVDKYSDVEIAEAFRDTLAWMSSPTIEVADGDVEALEESGLQDVMMDSMLFVLDVFTQHLVSGRFSMLESGEDAAFNKMMEQLKGDEND